MQTHLIKINRALRDDGRPGDVARLRYMIRANAIAVENLDAKNPEHRDAILELLGPPPVTGPWDLDFSDGRGMWTCGLVAEGIWRRMRVACRSLYEPYLPGRAIARAVAFALDCNAWVRPGSGRRPRVGDYVLLNVGSGQHALTVTGWTQDVCESVDGGQLHDGWQATALIDRTWVDTGERTSRLGSRQVYGWIDAARLRYQDSWCYVPAGFEVI